MKKFQQYLEELEPGSGTPEATNDMRYSNRSVGGLGSKEDYFLSQLQQKSAALGPEQRFKILGDVLVTLFPEPTERMRWVNILRQQNMSTS